MESHSNTWKKKQKCLTLMSTYLPIAKLLLDTLKVKTSK